MLTRRSEAGDLRKQTGEWRGCVVSRRLGGCMLLRGEAIGSMMTLSKMAAEVLST